MSGTVVCYGYVRVSSTDQEDKLGPVVQQNEIVIRAKELGLPDPDIRHETKTGTTRERPVLKKIFQDCKEVTDSGGQAHIIFKCMDRFSRELVDMELLLVEAWDAGAKVHSCVHGEEPYLDRASCDDPTVVLIRQILSAFVQYERAKLHGRMESGRVEKSKKGGFIGGKPPFGYRIVEKDLVPDVAKVAVIKRLFMLVDAKHSDEYVAEQMKREFPEVETWVKDKTKPKYLVWREEAVIRIKEKRRLYAEGYFKDSAGDEHVRTDLVIL
jgi:DNA invertase Pin-like site-specific DNA recombinase